jgi:hypothetical protein
MPTGSGNNVVDMDVTEGVSERSLYIEELSDNGRNYGCTGASLLIVSGAEERCPKTSFLAQVLAKCVGNGRLACTSHAAKPKDGRTVVACPLFEPVHQFYTSVARAGPPRRPSGCCVRVKECLRSKGRKRRGLGLDSQRPNKYENTSAYQHQLQILLYDSVDHLSHFPLVQHVQKRFEGQRKLDLLEVDLYLHLGGAGKQ